MNLYSFHVYTQYFRECMKMCLHGMNKPWKFIGQNIFIEEEKNQFGK